MIIMISNDALLHSKTLSALQNIAFFPNIPSIFEPTSSSIFQSWNSLSKVSSFSTLGPDPVLTPSADDAHLFSVTWLSSISRLKFRFFDLFTLDTISWSIAEKTHNSSWKEIDVSPRHSPAEPCSMVECQTRPTGDVGLDFPESCGREKVKEIFSWTWNCQVC